MDQFVYYYKFDSIKSEIEKFDVGMIEAKDDIYCTVLFLRLNKSITILKKDLKKINLVKTGDEFENKICDRCYKYLNTEELFSNNRIKKGNKITKRPSCKNCRKLIDGKSITKIEKMRWIKIKPINELFSCPICNKKSYYNSISILIDKSLHL